MYIYVKVLYDILDHLYKKYVIDVTQYDSCDV